MDLPVGCNNRADYDTCFLVALASMLAELDLVNG